LSKRHACVLSTGRQDYGILRSTLRALRDAPDFELSVVVGGMHLAERFGHTIDVVRQDGVTIARELNFLAPVSNPIEESSRALSQMACALKELRPEFLLLVGDRHETLVAGIAASLLAIPIVHLHGGEESEGAMDNAFRHALTKLSHLHLVSHPLHAQRVRQMGERAEDVVVVGAPGLDNLCRDDLPQRDEVAQRLGIALESPVVVVTLHPATLGGDPEDEVRALAVAMDSVPATYVITHPNADDGGDRIRAFWSEWVCGRERVALVEALGERFFWGLLKMSDVVLGNSSSGIVEAPALGLPVIDVGDRQRGRLRDRSVINVPAEPESIADALCDAISRGITATPFVAGQGVYPAAERILEALRRWTPPAPPRKVFVPL
jgi:UDP-hydrolysing UDP-N-acetyl-D-glucosamine 2-epimerase